MRWAYDNGSLIRIPVKRACNGYYLRWYYNGWHYWFFLPGVHTVETEGENYRTLSTRKITVSSGQVTRGQAVGIRTIMNTREVYMWAENGWASIRIEPGSIKIYHSEIAGTEMEMTLVIGSREVTLATGFSPVPTIPDVPPTYTWCELPITIADQVWMCKNYDIAYPGSKVYNNDEANRAALGGLYTWNQVIASGFCPTGWHVPTVAEWQALITVCGGDAVAGGVLKEVGTTRWSAPNTGAVDTYGFAAVGGGLSTTVAFARLYELGMFWTADEDNTPPLPPNIYANYARMTNDSASAIFNLIEKTNYLSVRLIRDTALVIYPVVYGYIYNRYAVADARNITAAGWHVPTETEFDTLGAALGGDAIAGGKMKETGTTYWDIPNTGADNSSGLNCRGGGYRLTNGSFTQLKVRNYLWASTLFNLVNGNFRNILSDSAALAGDNSGVDFKNGFSVRPIKDTTTLTDGQVGTYVGNDLKVYRTICVGTQEYVADPVCETLYRDGTPIPEVTGAAAWAALTTGARCSYDNDESNAHA